MNLYVFERDGKTTDDFIQEVNEWVNLQNFKLLIISLDMIVMVIFKQLQLNGLAFRKYKN